VSTLGRLHQSLQDHLALNSAAFQTPRSMMYAVNEGEAAPTTAGRAPQGLTEQLDQRIGLTAGLADTGQSGMTTQTVAEGEDAPALALTDVLDAGDPHTLLTSTRAALFSAHGPFDGERRARDYAIALPIRRPVAFSRTVALHHPDQLFLPDDEWLPIPAALAQRASADTAYAPTTVLVLLDRPLRLVAAVGPFPPHATATAWHPSTPLPDRVHRLPLGLQPVVTTWTNA
jgi:hypothetical protein